MIPIKKDGSMCFFGDYCPLNTQSRRDVYPMPLIDNVLSQMGVAKWFTTLDLQSGFKQIKVNPNDVKKTTFITKTSLYEWLVMPIGLKNATSIFSKIMTNIFFEWLQ